MVFGSDVFKSFFYSTVWFGLNQTKPNHDIRKTIIKYISFRPILVEIQWKV